MPRLYDLFLTTLAPVVWGSSYIVTTEFLPDGYPLTVAMLRALPAGLLLLLLVRKLPGTPLWWGRVFVLGFLNFSFFWWMLFVAAYRLPGGVAATLGAVQPLIIVFLSWFVLKKTLSLTSIIAAVAGVLGVAMLVLNGQVTFDWVGCVAALAGAGSMALGTVYTRKWQPPVSLLTFTSWQLVAGGLLLLPASLFLEPVLPELSQANWLGFLYLGLIGGAVTYLLWFRGIAKITPEKVSLLALFSPLSAVMLGWVFLNQALGLWQLLGALLILGSVWLGQQKFEKLDGVFSVGKI